MTVHDRIRRRDPARTRELRVALAAAPGGHLTELLSLAPAYSDLPHFYVISRSPARTDDPLGRVYWVADYGPGRLPRRLAALCQLSATSLRIYFTERPNVLLTTGPAVGLPLALLIRARGGRVLFIECSAQVTNPSRSGRLFHPFAQRFFVQWPALRAFYKRAEYGGPLL